MRELVISILDRARHSVGTQLGIGILVGFFAPTVLLVIVSSVWAGTTGLALYLISVAYLTTCALMLVEANLSFRRNPRSEPAASSDGWVPEVSIVVVAYLPNEAALVMDTLQHLIDEVDYPGESPQVILAYNTPHPMKIESDLQALAHRTPMLDVIRIEGSTSKAENVMGVLSQVRNPVVAILDTDHQLHRDAVRRAIRWFDGGYDVVQGRCVVRNARHNLLTRMVAFEFETIYGIAHAGRSLLVDTGI
ncbi:MAG: glycosyltransferase, partial [Solirubrobacteraceae bacterium]|nr:glycosyltransferase [Solirubrobacteraceae bacterium]